MNDIAKDQACSVCGRFNNRGITVDAVIIRDNRILLVKRRDEPFKGNWALPGGYVEWDESVPEAMAREVSEETGLKAIDLNLVGVYSVPDRDERQAVTIAYLVEAIGNPMVGDDAADYKFVSLGELPANLAFDHDQIIKDALKLN